MVLLMLSDAASRSYWFTWFPGACLAMLSVFILFWRGVRWMVKSTETMRQISDALPLLQAEFHPNGGKSMHDRMEALHVKVEDMAHDTGRWQRKHAADDDRRFAKTDAALERIEDHLTR